MGLNIRIEPPITVFQQGILKASERIIAAVEHEMAAIAERARETAQIKTPGKVLPTKWKVTKSFPAGLGSPTFTVHNTDERFNRLVELSDGRLTNLGEMLEYGTRKHLIRAKTPGGMLAFYWPAVGRMVFVKNPKAVEHPGTRPYGMIRAAHITASGYAARMGAVVTRIIGRGIT